MCSAVVVLVHHRSERHGPGGDRGDRPRHWGFGASKVR
jgi:hypothetical protein